MFSAIILLAMGIVATPASAWEPDRVEPATAVETWLSRKDTPRNAPRGKRTYLGFVLEVNAAGVVTACRISTPSRIEGLDAATCDILKRRARFRPMTAAGAFVSSVGWELGKEPEITSPRNGRIDRSGLPQASPVENPMPWLDRSVYPPAALAAGIEGRVVLTVEVDASGSATGCRIVVSSGSNLLDSGTCDVLRARGKFRPAVDAMGMRVDGGWTTTVTWMI